MRYTNKISIPLICPLHFEEIESNEFYINQNLYKQAFKIGDIITIQIRFNTGVISYEDKLKLRIKNSDGVVVKEQIFLLYELSSIYSYGICSLMITAEMNGCYYTDIYSEKTEEIFAEAHPFYITDSELFCKLGYTHSENDFDVIFDKKQLSLSQLDNGIFVNYYGIDHLYLNVRLDSIIPNLYLMLIEEETNEILLERIFTATVNELNLSTVNGKIGHFIIATKIGANIDTIYYQSNLVEVIYTTDLSLRNINDGYFYYRFEGGFIPNKLNFNLRTSSIGDQNEVDNQTYGMPNETEKLTIGANYGIPNWFIRKINRTFACDTIEINNIEYSKNENSKLEIIERGEENLNIGFGIYEIELEKSLYSFLERDDVSDNGIFSSEFDNTFE